MQPHQAAPRPTRTLITRATLAIATLAFTACFTTMDQLTPEEIGVTEQAINPNANVVISQIYGGGRAGTGTPPPGELNADYVELFNRGMRDAPLTGWSLQYGSSQTANGNVGIGGQLLALTATIPPGGYYLIKINSGSDPSLISDAQIGFSMSYIHGKVALVQDTAALGCGGVTACTQAKLDLIEDLVGYGVATTFFEGAPTPNTTGTAGATRRDSGCADSNNNAGDFVIAPHAFRNSTSPAHPCQMFVRTSPTGSTTCVVRAGKAMCWGVNTSGKLGQGNTISYGAGNVDGLHDLADLSLIDVGTDRLILDLTVGNTFVCALLDDHSLKCWGNANHIGLGGVGGNRGDGANEMGNNLAVVQLDGNTTMLGQAGGTHVCVRTDATDTPLKCFGANNNAQVGWGHAPSDSPPVMMPPLPADTYVVLGNVVGETGAGNPAVTTGGVAGTTVIASAGGAEHNCVITSDNKVRCWGANTWGQLGRQSNVSPWGDTSTEMSALHEVFVGTGRYAIAIAAGSAHTCVIRDDHSVVCWGENASGQLGRGATAVTWGNNNTRLGDAAGELEADAHLVAVTLGTGRTAVAITAGDHHTCALLDNGSVTCWGANGSGQLGRGVPAGNTAAGGTPVILGGHTAISIAGGASYTCAVLDDFSVRCWGSNAAGALGYDLSTAGTNNAIGDTTAEMNALGTTYTVDLIF